MSGGFAGPAATVAYVNEFAVAVGLCARFEFVAATGSTNSDLVRAAAAGAGEWPEFSCLVAGHQTAGRGRLNRQWDAPAGSGLFASVLLRPSPEVVERGMGWLPLLAGLAMRDSVAALCGGLQVASKWPNDVLISSRDYADGGWFKVSGILCEALPDLAGVVVGAGVNLAQTAAELPVAGAASLAMFGQSVQRGELLVEYLRRLRAGYAQLVAAGGDARVAGLQAAVEHACLTLGQRVRVILPAGVERLGAASGIDGDGRLLVVFDGERQATPVAAGNIVHLRHNPAASGEN